MCFAPWPNELEIVALNMYCVEIANKIRRALPSLAQVFFLSPILLTLSGCDLKIPSFGSSQDESKRLSPRVVAPGQPVPKGGGRYKLGKPYRIHGRLYVPEEVSHYEETGVASWYGEMFHGRRTANGEIYDMEALSAAHPTLPMPSYVRVTNLRNGRSLVLRVNDRGPYKRGRSIDLSWAAASLLKMEKTGTAPVRVEYLGRAPLSGSDRYERDYLARQRWAGPQIAFAKSPGKAARRFRSLHAQASGVNRNGKKPAKVASMTPDRSVKRRIAPLPVPPLPVSRSIAVGKIEPKPSSPASKKVARNVVSVKPDHLADRRTASQPASRPIVDGSAQQSPLHPATRKVARNSVSSPAATQKNAMHYYVQAGRFNHKSLADQLASILQEEIAPASVETAQSGNDLVHLVKVGPFRQDAEAQVAVARLKAAGLKDAYVERFSGS